MPEDVTTREPLKRFIRTIWLRGFLPALLAFAIWFFSLGSCLWLTPPMTSSTLFLGGGAISGTRMVFAAPTGPGPVMTRRSQNSGWIHSDRPVWRIGRLPLSWSLDAGSGWSGVTIPLVYPFVILLLAAPLLDRSGRRRRRRIREGRCVHCAYQLGPSTVRCPECGRDVAGANPQ